MKSDGSAVRCLNVIISVVHQLQVPGQDGMFAGSRFIFISFEHHKHLFPSELLLVIICYCCVFVEGTRTSLSSLLQPTSCQTATAVPVTQLDIFKDTFGHFRFFFVPSVLWRSRTISTRDRGEENLYFMSNQVVFWP